MISKKEPFKNTLYIEQYGDDFTCLKGFEGMPQGNLRYVNRISFQLSNLCNYSIIHKKCPLSQTDQKQILSTRVVNKVLHDLGQKKYQGLIGFHIYNEPMIDPRLFLFIREAKKNCPKAKCLILTNGFYLNETMMEELYDIGVDLLHVSAYTSAEYDRLIRLDNHKMPFFLMPMALDNRMNMYDADELNLSKTCSAPLNEICIAPTGEIILCCLDWQNKHTFGNLNDHNLEEIVNSQKVHTVFSQLSDGKRLLHLCKRCNWSR